jgi:hypothetical protein
MMLDQDPIADFKPNKILLKNGPELEAGVEAKRKAIIQMENLSQILQQMPITHKNYSNKSDSEMQQDPDCDRLYKGLFARRNKMASALINNKRMRRNDQNYLS